MFECLILKASKWQVKVFVELAGKSEMIQGGGICQNFGHVMYGG